MKFIRDYNQIGKRERLAAGIVNTIISIAIILYLDSTMGTPLLTSIMNICITAIVGISFCTFTGVCGGEAQSRRKRCLCGRV